MSAYKLKELYEGILDQQTVIIQLDVPGEVEQANGSPSAHAMLCELSEKIETIHQYIQSDQMEDTRILSCLSQASAQIDAVLSTINTDCDII